jgi:hypothetical protein
MQSALDNVYQPSPVENPPQHARAAVHIDEADLRSEMIRIPADLAYYGHQLAVAHRRVTEAKLELESVEGFVYLEVREMLEDLADSKKGPTEATIKAKTAADVRIRNARAQMIEAEFEMGQVRAHVDAVRAKREMLVSLSALARAEMGPTSVRADFGKGRAD